VPQKVHAVSHDKGHHAGCLRGPFGRPIITKQPQRLHVGIKTSKLVRDSAIHEQLRYINNSSSVQNLLLKHTPATGPVGLTCLNSTIGIALHPSLKGATLARKPFPSHLHIYRHAQLADGERLGCNPPCLHPPLPRRGENPEGS